VVVKEWPISVNIERPFLPVSATSLLNESINEMISMDDPKYALPALIIISDSSILVLFNVNFIFDSSFLASTIES
jgi:hypothetical protein